MTQLTEIIFVAFLAIDMLMLVSSRLLHCIELVAIQGLLLGVLPLVIRDFESSPPLTEMLLISGVNIIVKAVVLPALLVRTMRSANVGRELEPLVGYSFSVVIGLLVGAGSFLFCRQINFGGQAVSLLTAPVAFSTILIGLFMVMARRKAITQVIGFLMFENGIAIFGTGMTLEYGLIVELGILLDVFVLVFIMGIAVFRISHEFNHIDADRLNHLGDWSRPEEPGVTAEENN